MTAVLKAWAPAGFLHAWWIDDTLWVTTALGDYQAARRCGAFWRLYNDLSIDQIATVDGAASREQVVKVVETLWATTLRVTEVRAGTVGRRGATSSEA